MNPLRSIDGLYSPRVGDFLDDWREAPRQFKDRFLAQENLRFLDIAYLESLKSTALDELIDRWEFVGVLPAGKRTSGATHSTRPQYGDPASVAEMMRGMFPE